MDTQTSARLNHQTEWSPVAVLRHDAAHLAADFFRHLYPDLAARCNGRIERAVEIMIKAGARTRGEHPGEFIVKSESNARGAYVVNVHEKTCTCPDHGKNPHVICKHRLSIGLAIFLPDWIETATCNRIAALSKAQKKLDAALARLAEIGNTLEHFAVLEESYGIQRPAEEVENIRLQAATAEAEVKALAAEKAALAAAPLCEFL